jgi:beta-phosphoglucomutase family hydrolase
MGAEIPAVSRARFDAVLFDLDGVITATAKVHAACWKRAFDEFLKKRADDKGEDFQPFDIKRDYEDYVDGKPRDEGVRSFLKSRKIELPEGNPDDPPDRETVAGVGNRKTKLFEQALQEGGVDVYEGSLDWLKKLRQEGIKTAIVSSSKHCKMILEAAGLSDLFEARVDGKVSEELGLKGKPAPDIFRKAAEMLGARPERAVVVEDAIAGVQAGRAGGFGLVIGVGRSREAEEALRKNGADVVVKDLQEMLG